MAALRPSTSGQVFESDHTDSSDSDIDVSDLINHSDQNLSYPVNRDKEAFPGGGQGPANQEVSNDSISQNDINRQILQQLSNLGDRLAVIEGNRGHKLFKRLLMRNKSKHQIRSSVLKGLSHSLVQVISKGRWL